VPSALATAAQHAKDLGFTADADIKGLVDLSVLDEVRGASAK
jgi:NitT/TauT family transport system substrate-binding protein